MSTSDFPKVLIVSAVPLGSETATGITLCNLFSDWPSNSIAQLYDSPAALSQKSPRYTYQFTSEDIPIVRVAKSLLRPTTSPSLSSPSASTAGASYNPMGAISDIAPFALPASLINWARAFKPDLIYTLMGSARFTALSYKLARKLEIPVIPHFMDDWPETIYTRSWGYALPRLVLRKRLMSLLRLSPYGFTIGQDMAIEYEQRYKRPFKAFMNCAPITQKESVYHAEDPIKFGYIGGLHLNRWKSLLEVIQALDSLRNEGYKLEMYIHTSQKDIEKFSAVYSSYPVIKEISSIPPDDVPQRLSHFDVLLHVESFHESDILYTRLSLSTKIPQYLAAGKPIFAFAPAELSSTKYILNNETGIAVTTAEISQIKGALCALISEPGYREHLAQNAIKLAQKNHDIKLQRRNFKKHLQQAVPKL